MKKNITLNEAAANVIKGYEDTVSSLTSMELNAPEITPEDVDSLSRQIDESSEKVIREFDAEIDAL